MQQSDLYTLTFVQVKIALVQKDLVILDFPSSFLGLLAPRGHVGAKRGQIRLDFRRNSVSFLLQQRHKFTKMPKGGKVEDERRS